MSSKRTGELTVTKILLMLSLVFVPQLASAQTNTFPASGNAGVGTTTPDQSANLHIYNASDGGGIDIQAAASGGWSRLRLRTATRIYGWFAGDASQPDAPNKIGLLDYTAGAFRMMVDSGGNVGIGTTGPLSLLNINTTANNGSPALTISGGTGSGANVGQLDFYSNSGTTVVSRLQTTRNGANNSGQLDFYTANLGTLGSRMTILPGGNVGIGTGAPNYKLDVNGEINATGIRINGTPISGGGGTSPWLGAGPIYYDGGNVGIGTTNPTASKLQIQKAAGVGLALLSGSTSAGQHTSMQIGRTSVDGSLGVASQAGEYATDAVAGDIILRSESSSNKLILNSGTGAATLVVNNSNVGIGTTSPTKKLHVAGDLQVDGNINAKYQDLAEWVPSSEHLAAGTVVVLDQNKSNQVISSTAAYDTRVAGVISAQPGITLGESGEGKVLVATTGRVRVKVDASRGAIQIGDLLVTSDVPGVAMKSEAVEFAGRKMHMPGTIIGKALEPLTKGQSEILVLLSLQ